MKGAVNQGIAIKAAPTIRLMKRNLAKKGASMKAIPKKWSMPNLTYPCLEISHVIKVIPIPHANIFKPLSINPEILPALE